VTNIVKGIFGGTPKGVDRLRGFTPASFSAPGLTGRFANNRFSLNRTPAGNAALEDLRRGFTDKAAELRDLRPQVAPGFGRLTKSRVEAIRGAGRRAVGNLREELSRRRVLGSSFAQREVASTEAEFGRQEEMARAESFLSELDLTNQLINQEFDAATRGAAAVLGQLNFETSLAAELSSQASNQNNANRIAQAQAQAESDRLGFDFLEFLF
jgi:hypothetical protein